MTEAVARDIESIRNRPGPQIGLDGTSSYEDGRWTLVFTRKLSPGAPEGAAAIVKDGLTSLAFAVWDGGNPNTYAVSPWIELSIREKNAAAHGH
jgi:hypothetical protein